MADAPWGDAADPLDGYEVESAWSLPQRVAAQVSRRGPRQHPFLFVIEGELETGDRQTVLGCRTLGILSQGDRVVVQTSQGARFLLVSALPLNEPVARGGPFVMNTKEEIVQAFDDYRHNRF